MPSEGRWKEVCETLRQESTAQISSLAECLCVAAGEDPYRSQAGSFKSDICSEVLGRHSFQTNHVIDQETAEHSMLVKKRNDYAT